MSRTQSNDGFDFKNSLVYMNSTAALMETLFKNMKNEDFVYPAKKQISADEGAIIRSEELLRRQQTAAAETIPFVIRDPYLESMLAKMTDEDFTYETKKPVDPNYGRVVRALELMELTGCSTASKSEVAVKEEKREASIQKENIMAPVEQKRQTETDSSRRSYSGSGDCEGAGATPDNGQKRFGGSYKKQNNKNRVKYDIPTWKNDRRSFGNDNSSHGRRQSNDNYRPANNNGHLMSNNNSHFYENRTFSQQNGMFNNFGANKSQQHKNNGFGHGSSRGRGNHQYNAQQRTLENNTMYWNNNQALNGAPEFWGQPANVSMWK